MSPSAACAEQAHRKSRAKAHRVRVAVESEVVRDRDAADDQLATRHQRMHVESLPDSHLALRIASAIARSSGYVTLRFARLPATIPRPQADLLDRGRLVGHVALGFTQRPASASRRGNICGVCASHSCERSSVPAMRCAPASSFRDALQRFGDRQHEDAADAIFRALGDQPLEVRLSGTARTRRRRARA
jgi:hypothetical protein